MRGLRWRGGGRRDRGSEHGRPRLAVGDRVLPLGRGNWADCRTLSADRVLRSPDKARTRLIVLGALAVIADSDGMADAAMALMDGAKARLALDFVTDAATGHLARCLTPGGRVTVAGQLDPAPCSIPSTLLTGGSIITDGFSLRPKEGMAGCGELQAMYDAPPPL